MSILNPMIPLHSLPPMPQMPPTYIYTIPMELIDCILSFIDKDDKESFVNFGLAFPLAIDKIYHKIYHYEIPRFINNYSNYPLDYLINLIPIYGIKLVLSFCTKNFSPYIKSTNGIKFIIHIMQNLQKYINYYMNNINKNITNTTIADTTIADTTISDTTISDVFIISELSSENIGNIALCTIDANVDKIIYERLRDIFPNSNIDMLNPIERSLLICNFGNKEVDDCNGCYDYDENYKYGCSCYYYDRDFRNSLGDEYSYNPKCKNRRKNWQQNRDDENDSSNNINGYLTTEWWAIIAEDAIRHDYFNVLDILLENSKFIIHEKFDSIDYPIFKFIVNTLNLLNNSKYRSVRLSTITYFLKNLIKKVGYINVVGKLLSMLIPNYNNRDYVSENYGSLKYILTLTTTESSSSRESSGNIVMSNILIDSDFKLYNYNNKNLYDFILENIIVDYDIIHKNLKIDHLMVSYSIIPKYLHILNYEKSLSNLRSINDINLLYNIYEVLLEIVKIINSNNFTKTSLFFKEYEKYNRTNLPKITALCRMLISKFINELYFYKNTSEDLKHLMNCIEKHTNRIDKINETIKLYKYLIKNSKFLISTERFKKSICISMNTISDDIKNDESLEANILKQTIIELRIVLI